MSNRKVNNISLKILRFNSEKDGEPYYQTFDIKPTNGMRVLDALFQVLETKDHSLAFRYSCRSAVCGSCAMLINGWYRLACATLVSDLGRKITVQPLPHMPVIKDLVVDVSSFFEKYEIIKPYVVPTKLPPVKEWIQSPDMRSRIDEATDCIMCASCYSACPSVWSGKKYLGPAALLQAYRFAADSRDGILRERTNLLASEEGLWRCHTIFNCSEACPKNLNPARFIQALKRAAAKESMKVQVVTSR